MAPNRQGQIRNNIPRRPTGAARPGGGIYRPPRPNQPKPNQPRPNQPRPNRPGGNRPNRPGGNRPPGGAWGPPPNQNRPPGVGGNQGGGGGQGPNVPAAPPTPQLPNYQSNEGLQRRLSENERRYRDTLTGLGDQEKQLGINYGMGQFGGDIASNPYSRAALLQRSYNQNQRASTNTLASRGQLYAGAASNAFNTNRFNFAQSQDALQKDYAARMAAIEARRQAASNALYDANEAANREAVDDASKLFPSTPENTAPGGDGYGDTGYDDGGGPGGGGGGNRPNRPGGNRPNGPNQNRPNRPNNRPPGGAWGNRPNQQKPQNKPGNPGQNKPGNPGQNKPQPKPAPKPPPKKGKK